MTAGDWLAIVVVFGGLVLLHEFGHFLLAKRAGVQVDEFALGFGPRLAHRQWGETDYSLRLLPLGGYVRMAGMYPNESDGSLEAERSREANRSGNGWAAKRIGPRVAIIAAGPCMNFLVAVALVAFVFGAIGVPGRPSLVIAGVQQGYPARAAGLRPGDRILSVDGQPISGWNALHGAISPRAGSRITVVVERDGRDLTFSMTPVPKGPDGSGLIGIRPVVPTVRLTPWTAVAQGAVWTWQIVAGWFIGLAGIVRGGGAGQLLGPVGIGQQIGVAAQAGLADLLLFTAALSANLGLINLLPIPALDGSRLVFLGIEKLRGRPVDPAKEGFVHMLGFALLVTLMLFITYHDILRLT